MAVVLNIGCMLTNLLFLNLEMVPFAAQSFFKMDKKWTLKRGLDGDLD